MEDLLGLRLKRSGENIIQCLMHLELDNLLIYSTIVHIYANICASSPQPSSLHIIQGESSLPVCGVEVGRVTSSIAGGEGLNAGLYFPDSCHPSFCPSFLIQRS